MALPSWGIVSTVDEPAQLVIAFAAYHLGLGAAEVHLYLDRPNPEAQAALAGLPGLRLTVCDAAYWALARGGRRPKSTTSRQTANVADAYRRTGTDWLLHIDADEFIRDPAVLTDAIAAAPADLDYIKLGMLERVRRIGAPVDSIFDGAFRSFARGSEHWVGEVYGRFAKFLPQGVAGHWVGKSLIRTGIDGIAHSVHYPERPGGAPLVFSILPKALYHFDGLTPMHMALKLLGRFDWQNIGDQNKLAQIGRGAQIRYLRNNRLDRRALERLIQGIQFVTPQQKAELDVRGLLWRAPFDPTPVLDQMDLTPDLSAAGFDAALRARMADRIAETGFAEATFGA